MDRHTKKQRSYNMSRIRSENTKPEILMFSMLERSGYNFEKHYSVAGKPDIAFPEQRVVVFIDGEFWHGKNFLLLRKKLSSFWLKKIGENIKRDHRNNRILRSEGWHILHLWDKKIIHYPERSFQRIVKFLEKRMTNI